MHFSKAISFASLGVVLVVLFLQLGAILSGWYETYPWFDILMHCLGGLFSIFFGTSLFYRLRQGIPPVVFLVLFVVVVGVWWEVFEYGWQALVKEVVLATPLDSIGDLAADMGGGIIGIFFVQQAKKRYNRKDEQ